MCAAAAAARTAAGRLPPPPPCPPPARRHLSPSRLPTLLPPCLCPAKQGYFQPDVGGKNIPVAQGELSDLAGDEPLFKALYKWWVLCLSLLLLLPCFLSS